LTHHDSRLFYSAALHRKCFDKRLDGFIRLFCHRDVYVHFCRDPQAVAGSTHLFTYPDGAGPVGDQLACVPVHGRARRIPQAVAILLTVLICGANLPHSLETVSRLHAEGYGYTSRMWQQSELIAQVRSLPPGTPLISNQPAPIFFLTGRPSYDLVSSLAHADRPANIEPYGSNPGDPNQILFRDRRAGLVIFDLGIYEQLRGIYGEDPMETLRRLTDGLEVAVRVGDGVVFFP